MILLIISASDETPSTPIEPISIDISDAPQATMPIIKPTKGNKRNKQYINAGVFGALTAAGLYSLCSNNDIIEPEAQNSSYAPLNSQSPTSYPSRQNDKRLLDNLSPELRHISNNDVPLNGAVDEPQSPISPKSPKSPKQLISPDETNKNTLDLDAENSNKINDNNKESASSIDHTTEQVISPIPEEISEPQCVVKEDASSDVEKEINSEYNSGETKLQHGTEDYILDDITNLELVPINHDSKNPQQEYKEEIISSDPKKSLTYDNADDVTSEIYEDDRWQYSMKMSNIEQSQEEKRESVFRNNEGILDTYPNVHPLKKSDESNMLKSSIYVNPAYKKSGRQSPTSKHSLANVFNPPTELSIASSANNSANSIQIQNFNALISSDVFHKEQSRLVAVVHAGKKRSGIKKYPLTKNNINNTSEDSVVTFKAKDTRMQDKKHTPMYSNSSYGKRPSIKPSSLNNTLDGLEDNYCGLQETGNIIHAGRYGNIGMKKQVRPAIITNAAQLRHSRHNSETEITTPVKNSENMKAHLKTPQHSRNGSGSYVKSDYLINSEKQIVSPISTNSCMKKSQISQSSTNTKAISPYSTNHTNGILNTEHSQQDDYSQSTPTKTTTNKSKLTSQKTGGKIHISQQTINQAVEKENKMKQDLLDKCYRMNANTSNVSDLDSIKDFHNYQKQIQHFIHKNKSALTTINPNTHQTFQDQLDKIETEMIKLDNHVTFVLILNELRELSRDINSLKTKYHEYKQEFAPINKTIATIQSYVISFNTPLSTSSIITDKQINQLNKLTQAPQKLKQKVTDIVNNIEKILALQNIIAQLTEFNIISQDAELQITTIQQQSPQDKVKMHYDMLFLITKDIFKNIQIYISNTTSTTCESAKIYFNDMSNDIANNNQLLYAIEKDDEKCREDEVKTLSMNVIKLIEEYQKSIMHILNNIIEFCNQDSNHNYTITSQINGLRIEANKAMKNNEQNLCVIDITNIYKQYLKCKLSINQYNKNLQSAKGQHNKWLNNQRNNSASLNTTNRNVYITTNSPRTPSDLTQKLLSSQRLVRPELSKTTQPSKCKIFESIVAENEDSNQPKTSRTTRKSLTKITRSHSKNIRLENGTIYEKLDDEIQNSKGEIIRRIVTDIGPHTTRADYNPLNQAFCYEPNSQMTSAHASKNPPYMKRSNSVAETNNQNSTSGYKLNLNIPNAQQVAEAQKQKIYTSAPIIDQNNNYQQTMTERLIYTDQKSDIRRSGSCSARNAYQINGTQLNHPKATQHVESLVIPQLQHQEHASSQQKATIRSSTPAVKYITGYTISTNIPNNTQYPLPNVQDQVQHGQPQSTPRTLSQNRRIVSSDMTTLHHNPLHNDNDSSGTHTRIKSDNSRTLSRQLPNITTELDFKNNPHIPQLDLSQVNGNNQHTFKETAPVIIGSHNYPQTPKSIKMHSIGAMPQYYQSSFNNNPILSHYGSPKAFNNDSGLCSSHHNDQNTSSRMTPRSSLDLQQCLSKINFNKLNSPRGQYTPRSHYKRSSFMQHDASQISESQSATKMTDSIENWDNVPDLTSGNNVGKNTQNQSHFMTKSSCSSNQKQ